MNDGTTSRLLTVPNVLSSLRIALIPVFVALISDHDTSRLGLFVFGAVVSTDWLDGAVARRTGQVSELGKILDPTADRLAIAAGLVALAARGVFPWWATIPILARDGAVLVSAAAALARRRVRIDVRFVGKAATFTLMISVGFVAWGNLGLPLERAFLASGWVSYAVGIVEYYIATWYYARDLSLAFARKA